MATLKIALEWFLNPDHLPLLAAREAAAAEGDTMELVVPDDHYDGFEALANGQVDAVVNEPLHLMERHRAALRSLGTFFHTDGGVLLSRSAQQRLREGGAIRVSSPVSNPVTDGLCRDILCGWFQRQGVAMHPSQITVYEGGFDHVANLRSGADAAWLAFANIEGVMVREAGLAVDMVTTTAGGVPGFSALELIAARRPEPAQQAALERLVARLNQAIPALQADTERARSLWYAATGETPNPTTDAMVTDTLTRFVAPVRPDAERWRAVWQHMQARGADIVDLPTYEALFAA